MERDSNTPAMLQLHAQLLFLERFFTVAYYFFGIKLIDISLVMNYAGLTLPHIIRKKLTLHVELEVTLFANVSHP